MPYPSFFEDYGLSERKKIIAVGRQHYVWVG